MRETPTESIVIRRQDVDIESAAHGESITISTTRPRSLQHNSHAHASNSAMTDGPTKRPHWLRFSLRMMLLLMALLCVGFAWLAVKLNAARQQHAIVAAILDAGGKVNFDYEVSNQGAYTTYYINAPPPTPPWLRAMLGDDFFRNVVKVEFFGKKIPESIIGQLSKLTELRELRLDIVRSKSWHRIHAPDSRRRPRGVRRTD